MFQYTESEGKEECKLPRCAVKTVDDLNDLK